MAQEPMPNPGPKSACALIPVGEREGAKPIPLVRPFVLIGSRNRSHLHLVSKSVSRNHACLIRSGGGYCLRDLGSRTGVVVNSRRVTESRLKDGDSVEIGSFRFRYTENGEKSGGVPTKDNLPAVITVEGREAVPLEGRTVLIGRRGKADISLTDQAVSKSHALVFESDGRHFIRDLGSRTGTLVNGKPAHHQPLEFGDEIKIADATFRYQPAVAETTAVGQGPQVIEEPTTLQQQTAADKPTDVEEPKVPEEVTVAVAEELAVIEEPTVQAVEPTLEAAEEKVTESFTEEPEEPPVPIALSGGQTPPVTALALPDDVDDAEGPVPWRTPEGRPIYVRMHVTPPVLWLPTVAELFSGSNRRS